MRRTNTLTAQKSPTAEKPKSAKKPVVPSTAATKPHSDNRPSEPKKPTAHEAQESELVQPIPLPDDLEDFTRDIKRRVQGQHSRFLCDTIAIGQAFLAASEKYGQPLKGLADKAGLDYTTVTQYVKVAECFGAEEKSWVRAQLPPSVDSIMRLSRLKPEQLEDAIKKGKVHPDMGRKAVKDLLTKYRPANSIAAPEKGTMQRGDNSVDANLEQETDAEPVAPRNPEPAGIQAEGATVRTDIKTIAELVNRGLFLLDDRIKSQRLSKRGVILFWEGIAQGASERAKGETGRV